MPSLRVVPSVGREEAWDRYVAAHPRSTFFHQMAWGRVLDRTFRFLSHSCMVLEGEAVRGVLPLHRMKILPFGRALVSSPLAVYGGAIADDEAARTALLEHARGLAEALQVRYLELRNEDPVPGLPIKDLYVTFRKEIHPDPEHNLAEIPRNERRMVRLGEKAGLEARIGERELLPGFYHVFSSSVRNLGSPVFPRSLFEHLLAEFPDACRILGVFRESRMVAGVMTFFHRDQVLPYYGGALREAFRYAVNDFMYWRLLCHAAERGYRTFDFGRSKRESGSYHYKRHWGFEPTPLAYQYDLVRQRTIPDLSPHNPRFSLGIEVWRRMPLWLSQRAGPWLSRYFA